MLQLNREIILNVVWFKKNCLLTDCLRFGVFALELAGVLSILDMVAARHSDSSTSAVNFRSLDWREFTRDSCKAIKLYVLNEKSPTLKLFAKMDFICCLL